MITKKSLDIIFHEIIKENCPDILEPEGKINIERIHQSPPEWDAKRETPRNVVAKFQSSQVKEKIFQAARKKQFKYCGNTIRITRSSSFYIKGLKGVGYHIPEGTRTKNSDHLPRKTEYNTSGEKLVFQWNWGLSSILDEKTGAEKKIWLSNTRMKRSMKR